jgi:hypothetical protein
MRTDNVQAKLRRPFWIELQSRYGNMFTVREQGEAATIGQLVDALTACLAQPQGCAVVPGLPQEQLGFCASFAAIAGLIAGFVSKLEPQGECCQARVWTVCFIRHPQHCYILAYAEFMGCNLATSVHHRLCPAPLGLATGVQPIVGLVARGLRNWPNRVKNG